MSRLKSVSMPYASSNLNKSLDRYITTNPRLFAIKFPYTVKSDGKSLIFIVYVARLFEDCSFSYSSIKLHIHIHVFNLYKLVQPDL